VAPPVFDETAIEVERPAPREIRKAGAEPKCKEKHLKPMKAFEKAKPEHTVEEPSSPEPIPTEPEPTVVSESSSSTTEEEEEPKPEPKKKKSKLSLIIFIQFRIRRYLQVIRRRQAMRKGVVLEWFYMTYEAFTYRIRIEKVAVKHTLRTKRTFREHVSVRHHNEVQMSEVATKELQVQEENRERMIMMY
jgi:hypothetical protein